MIIQQARSRCPGELLPGILLDAAQPAVDDLKGDHDLRERALQDVEPAGPAVEEAALPKQRVEGDEDRREPTAPTDAIDTVQQSGLGCQKVVRLTAGVALLGSEPTRERLAVVVEDDVAQLANPPVDHDTMPVAFVAIPGMFLAVEHRSRRIERRGQWAPVDAVDERRSVAADVGERTERLDFACEGLAQLVVRVERQHPVGRHARQSEVALRGKRVERAVDDARLGKTGDDSSRRVRAAAVDDEDSLGPATASSVRSMLGASL